MSKAGRNTPLLPWPAPGGNPLPPHTVHVSGRARYVHLEISPEHGLVVVVPRRFDRAGVPAVLREHRAWIERKLAEAAARPRPRHSSARPPGRVLLRSVAEHWPVAYRETAADTVAARQNADGRLVVSGAVGDHAACRAALRRWLGRRAREQLVPWLRMISDTFELRFDRAVVRNQRTRWASCSWTKTISVNQNLLFLPPQLVRYVFIHELCHLVHLHHSRRFWALVKKCEPDCRALEKAIDAAGRYVPRWALPERRR